MTEKNQTDTLQQIQVQDLRVEPVLYDFIEKEVLPVVGIASEKFWLGFGQIITQFAPKNNQLLKIRDELQITLDSWHKAHPGLLSSDEKAPNSLGAYKNFLTKIGYLIPRPDAVKVKVKNVDDELSVQAGPQLVVPILNARYALNAANARWGSLYDALYGTDVFSEENDLEKRGNKGGYNPKRGAVVINYCRHVLDRTCPLKKGSHVDSVYYYIKNSHLVVELSNGKKTELLDASQLVGFQGEEKAPSCVLLKHNGLHLEIDFDPLSTTGKQDPAGVKDLVIESALSTILDLEDSIVAVDAFDKTHAYRNWLTILLGTMTEQVVKEGKTLERTLNADRIYRSPNGRGKLTLPGRALLFIRNVGHLMTNPAIFWKAKDGTWKEIPEGIMDAVITSLIALVDVKRLKKDGPINSRKGSIYIVKPKMHGPDEVAFANELFEAVEDLLAVDKYTIKLGIMDEERRTSVNLTACIGAANRRVAFINTGFLDRTGDEIHSSMYAGPMIRKAEMKNSTWLKAYEINNVQAGLNAGMRGKAQIGKGMWAMPDLMAAMLQQKIAHPKSGANTAWVPSPTSATLHALHYHQVDVVRVQKELEADYKSRSQAKGYKELLDNLLCLPVAPNPSWNEKEIGEELDNNVQGILGYVVRWVNQGIGCSKVPDAHNVGLMEDRATLRISSQHIVNWLVHKVVSKEQVEVSLAKMAKVVDEQNAGDPHYQPMTKDLKISMAFKAAGDLIFKGLEQPNGYTEPLLHYWRLKVKCG